VGFEEVIGSRGTCGTCQRPLFLIEIEKSNELREWVARKVEQPSGEYVVIALKGQMFTCPKCGAKNGGNRGL
jgi:hypothetical protein